MSPGVLLLCLCSAAQDRPALSDAIDLHVPRISGYNAREEAGLVEDGEFLRRVMLDLAGAPPSLDDVRAFMANADPGKRAARVDALLASPRFADLWSRRLADVLLGNRHDAPGGASFTTWLRGRLEDHATWTAIIRELIEAEGTLAQVPSLAWKVAWAREKDEGAAFATALSRQLFGINLFCARCHDHAFDKWRVDDFHELAAFTRSRSVRKTPGGAVVEEGPFDPEAHVYDPWARQGWGKTQKIGPRLFGADAPAPGQKLSLALADGVLKLDYVDRAFINRVWSWLMGRGLVHPVEEWDLRNKSLSPALHRALELDYRMHARSLRSLIKAICLSNAYQRRSDGPGEVRKINFGHGVIRPLSAEQLSASVEVATRGAALADTEESYRISRLLWGRPGAETEITPLAPDARVVEWLREGREPRELLRKSPVLRRIGRGLEPLQERIEILFLAFLSRRPDADEAARFAAFLAGAAPDWEGAAWALLNSTEFMTRH